MKSVYPNARPMRLALPVSILFFLILFSVQTSQSQTFNSAVRVVNPFNGTGGSIGTAPSITTVNGNPAIAFYDDIRSNLAYVRATDADGTAWNNPIWIDSTGSVGGDPSLLIVNGFPAVSYYDNTNGDLKYVRATNADGSSWGTPITVDASGLVGLYTTMQIVNGVPAIAYYDYTNRDVKYVQAADINGSSWNTAITVDNSSGDVGRYISMQVVNGNPAITYFDNTNFKPKYVRATDANGSAWGAPITPEPSASNGTYTSLLVVNGLPAICYAGAGTIRFFGL
jgi:hypothetical protein